MIDRIYINEAIRIRKEYLENLLNVNKFEAVYHQLLEKLESAKLEFDKLDVDDSNLTQEHILKRVQLISIDLNLIVDKIKPYSEKIEKLDNEQRILYKTIKEKYQNITDDEIYEEIIPIIEEVDKNFDL